LILHFNALQEALQPEGNTNWEGILSKIENICSGIEVPVIAKEVGWGISAKTASQLINAGISALDVAGAGGTSWSEVEKHRSKNQRHAKISSSFRDWGIPTAESIRQVRKACPEAIIFASGGLRSGLDITKTIALGATLGGLASPFLITASKSEEETVNLIEDLCREIQITLFAVGSPDLKSLPGKLTRIK
jgi:isopentenyl-diphosphate delta-isomerase